jgi:DNA modification methylase
MTTVLHGHCINEMRKLPAGSVHCCVTSPPYWGLRDYGIAPVDWEPVSYAPMPGLPAIDVPAMTCVLGLEPTLEAFLGHIVAVFREVRRVLHKSGTLWCNMGDAYAGSWGSQGRENSGIAVSALSAHQVAASPRKASNTGSLDGTPGLKAKDLQGQPWRVAFALQADGWYLRSDIIWHKPNPMPESCTDRPTKAHEYLFLLTRSKSYFYDQVAVQEPASENTNARVSKADAAALGVDPRSSSLAMPNGWQDSPTYHGQNPNNAPKKGGTPKADGGAKALSKNNASMDAALAVMPPMRNLRDVWKADEDEWSQFQQWKREQARDDKPDVWTINIEGYAGAHFATFPTALVKPCILAGTSAKGCCPECGAPWTRLVEQVDTGRKQKMPDGMMTSKGSHGSVHPEGRQKGEGGKAVTTAVTTGWKPGCQCSARFTELGEPDPCTVLDPFGGSGTTGAVALELGRRAVLIELGAHHIPLIQQRCDITPGFQLH